MYYKNNNIDDEQVAKYEISLSMAQTVIARACAASSSIMVDTRLNFTHYERICPSKGKRLE